MSSDLLKLFGIGTEIDERSAAFLTKAISDNDLPGFDYLEYKKALSALEEMDMDADIAVQSSFKTAEIAGLTKAKLLEAAQHYLKVIDHEKKQFQDAMKNQYKVKVLEKEERLSFLNGGILDGQRRVQAIQGKIKELEVELNQVQQELDAAKNNLQHTEQKFVEACGALESVIQSDIEKFNQLL